MSKFRVKGPLFLAAASVSTLLVPRESLADWSVFDKNIAQLETAYTDHLTSVTDVVQQYLTQIATYNDPAGLIGINAVAQVNPNILAEAAQEDTMIANGATTAQYPLLGVPVLVKNSYDVAGLITDNGVSVLDGVGTPGSTTLVPTTNAFAVQQLINAGALIIGKANMSTMAYSYDGIDNAGGIVLNPYSPNRQPGGSSSGIGAGIASQFAMLGMGGETGGSIRVPSNANDDVGLKTSLGLIDPGGTWPLTPSRDVVGPIAKSVTDIAYAMNSLVAPSATNLFNGTPVYPTAAPGTQRPTDYTSYLNTNSLEGTVIAVPNSLDVTTTTATDNYEGIVVPSVQANFQTALGVLQSEGATVVYVDIPASTTYYSTIGASKATTAGFPYPYPTTTVGGTTPSSVWSNDAAAYYYEKQIEGYKNPTIKNLTDFANALLAGKNAGAGSPYSTLSSAYSNIESLAVIYQAGQAAGFESTNGTPDNPNAIEALQGLSSLRSNQLEAFMANPASFGVTGVSHINAFVAPTYGGVMPYVAKAFRGGNVPATDPYAVSGSATLLGRFEGNILGLPSLSVPMGFAPDGTPEGIQFIDQLDGEANLIGYGYAYEQASEMRQDPNLSFVLVPEPSAPLGLLMISGAALLIRRRRTT